MRARLLAALMSFLLVGAAPTPPQVDMQRMSDVTKVLASDEFQG